MGTGNLGSCCVENIIEAIEVLVLLYYLVFSLADKPGNQINSHAQFLIGSQSSQVDKDLQVVALEESHEVLYVDTSENLLLSHFLLAVLSSLLEDSAVLLFVLSVVGSFHSLGFDQL